MRGVRHDSAVGSTTAGLASPSPNDVYTARRPPSGPVTAHGPSPDHLDSTRPFAVLRIFMLLRYRLDDDRAVLSALGWAEIAVDGRGAGLALAFLFHAALSLRTASV